MYNVLYMYCNVQYMTICTYTCTCTCIWSKYSKYTCSQYIGDKHVQCTVHVLQCTVHDYMYIYMYMYMYMEQVQ